MLHVDWPAVWDQEVVNAVKQSLETTIRAALSRNPSEQLRGSVVVDALNFGSVPPMVALSSIRELSPAHSAVVLSVKYAGDASIALKGLQLNLDTTTYANDKGEDANHAVPFYCPFEMRLLGLAIEGNVLVEVCLAAEPAVASATATSTGEEKPSRISLGKLLPTHVLQATSVRGHGTFGDTSTRGGSSRAVSPTSTVFPKFEPRVNSAPAAAASPHGGSSAGSFHRRSRPGGVGLLFGGGGKRGMRHPDAPVSEFGSPARFSVTDGGGSFSSEASHAHLHSTFGLSASHPPFLLCDLAQRRVCITKKTILLQLFGDPIKNFRVESNFAPVQGANETIATQLRGLLAPAIERLKTEGLTINL